MSNERPLDPFYKGARQKTQEVGSFTFSAGTRPTPLPLARVGFLSGLTLYFRMSATLSGAATLGAEGVWAALRRMKVRLNTGAAELFDTSGFGAYLVQRFLNGQYSPDLAGIGATTPDSDIYSAPTTSGSYPATVTWNFCLDIPLAANDSTNFMTGLILLQSPDVTLTVEPEFGALADISAQLTALTGTVYVEAKYYDLPDPTRFAYPPLTAVRWLEETTAVTVKGANANIYTVPRGGKLLQLIHALKNNSAYSHSIIDALRIKTNKSEEVYFQRVFQNRQINRKQLGVDLPTGVVAWDFWHSEEGVSEGITRDAFDTEATATLESHVDIATSATLTSAQMTTLRRIVQFGQ